ncbi:uncharacterized protein LOC131627147 [Vicia villosa]|uniref:uncharacterized protein LOC131627147 n=1 Tax=Vicia villosa TaxID=3911 RepID=UPI00273A9D04|nr:uncharacterized protein LOC131627147 [Vicia villosa]
MSPLLFVLSMEYLSRIIAKIGERERLRFPENCEAIKLNHLSFADDVLLFCHEDYLSTYSMLHGRDLFSRTSGLYPNKGENEIYNCGTKDYDILKIFKASGFKRNNLPFIYIGMPINSKRISTKDCQILVDNITGRIRIWSSRTLSFTGILVLINAVLLTIHSYGVKSSLSKKKVIQEINAICRTYSWTCKTSACTPGNIAWDKICKPKHARGLSFKNNLSWNTAAIGKHV